MTRELFLHAGAHRTGTSSFQLTLAENRAVLEAAGFDLAYPGRDGAPGGRLGLKLPPVEAGEAEIAQGAERCAREIGAHLGAGRDKLILSEENIPGRMFPFFRGRFFPGAAGRIAALREGLGALGIARPKRLVYVLRDYESLFRSAYRKRAEDNAVGPFAEIAPRMLGMARGWPVVIRELRDGLAPESFHVVDYAVRGPSLALLERLLGAVPEGLVEPARSLNLSASDAALEVLQARYRSGETLERAAWQEIIATHAEDRRPRGFAEFNETQSARLRARYARDLDTIAALDGVTLHRV